MGILSGDDLKRAAAMEELPIDSLWTGGHVASRDPSTEAIGRATPIRTSSSTGTADLRLW
ncbi:hypothetical protein BCD49_33850 [Pseudofrankia sp. EUN1h]|nr:hypothetical protein BCD49_33850 [Pseudofrankia sp. EUN1h]